MPSVTVAHPDNPIYNLCNDYNDTNPTPHGFCTLIGVGGDRDRDDFCSDIGLGREWRSTTDKTSAILSQVGGEAEGIGIGVAAGAAVALLPVVAPLAPFIAAGVIAASLLENPFRDCYYDDCTVGHEFSSAGCDWGCCGISGAGGKCVRQKFNAAPFVCCFLDSVCVNNVSSTAKRTIQENNDGVYIKSADGTKYSDSGIPSKKPGGNRELNKTFDTCWQTVRGRRTCDPAYRDLGDTPCRDVVADFCKGNILIEGQEGWEQAWLKDASININAGDTLGGADTGRQMVAPCFYSIIRSMTQKCVTESTVSAADLDPNIIDPDGFKWSKDVFEGMFQNYIKDHGSPVGAINSDGDISSGMHDVIWEICNVSPGLCESSLKTICSGYTPDDVANDPAVAKWCGCYLSDSAYEKYIDLFQMNKECTPLCARNGNIPLVNSQGEIQYCQENVCLIDDVAVKMIETQGLLTFGNVCQSCGSSSVITNNDSSSTDTSSSTTNESVDDKFLSSKSKTETTKTVNKKNYGSSKTGVDINRCNCMVNNVDITTLDSSIKNGLNLINNCGQLSCFKTVNGEKIPVACSSNEEQSEEDFIKNVANGEASSSKEKKIRFAMIALGVLIIIVGFLWLLLRPKGI